MLFQFLQIKENRFSGYTFHSHGDIEVKSTNYYYQLLGIIVLSIYFIINAIEDLNNKSTLENKKFRVDFCFKISSKINSWD